MEVSPVRTLVPLLYTVGIVMRIEILNGGELEDFCLLECDAV